MLVEDGFDVKTLSVAEPDKAGAKSVKNEFRVGLIAPTTKPGVYEVFVSVGRRDGTPVYALPLDGDDGQRRYKIGRVEVK